MNYINISVSPAIASSKSRVMGDLDTCTRFENMIRPMMSTRLVLVKPWNWSTAKVRGRAAGVAAPEGVTTPDGVLRVGGEERPDSRAVSGGHSIVAVCVPAILDDDMSDRLLKQVLLVVPCTGKKKKKKVC